MNYTTLAVELRDDVATIWLDRPAKLNAINLTMIAELNVAIDQAAGSARALIVASSGANFCSGGDLSGGLSDGGNADGRDFGAVLDTHINPLISKLRGLPIPWITAVRGSAAGFGCAFALAADMVIASENARFLQAFARIGLVPDGGSTHILVRGAGRVRAMEAMLLAEPIDAATAREWGLINRVVADDVLDDAVRDIARRLAAGPTATLGLIRNAVWEAADADWSTVLASERAQQRVAGRSRDAGEGIAAFLARRPAVFNGN